MWYEYKIYKTDLWWSIYRKKHIWKLMLMQYLYSNENWWPNKWLAKVFYHKESAESALVVMRRKDEWKESD